MSEQNNNARAVCLDTETTGLSPQNGERITDVGAVEILERKVGGRRNTFQRYIDPEMEVPEEALKIHGMTRTDLIEFGGGKRFIDVVDDLLDFVRGSTLIIHNAPFDVGFLNEELRRCNAELGERRYGEIEDYVEGIFDTFKFAGTRFPRQRNNLNALCNRFGVSAEGREYHGALIDSDILADVYISLTREQRHIFEHQHGRERTRLRTKIKVTPIERPAGARLAVIVPSAQEQAAHRRLLARVVKESKDGCLWPQP